MITLGFQIDYRRDELHGKVAVIALTEPGAAQRLREKAKRVLNAVEAHGAPAELCHDLDDILTFLNAMEEGVVMDGGPLQ